jgi:hypothetical protein
MDKLTRVLNSFNNEPVDRAPVGIWFHFLGEESIGQACIDAHLSYYNNIDVDIIKIMCDNYFGYPILHEIKNPSDWRKLRPLGKDHPFIREQIERAKGIKSGLKEEHCIFYNVFAPFSSIRFGTSDELVMKHLREDPDAILYALDVIAQDNALLSELLITEGGCDGIYYCVQGGEMDRFTYDEYRKWITPSDKYVLEHANRFSTNNILHCCGWAGIKNRLSCWQDYTAKAVNWAVFVENMSLSEGKKYFGNKAVLGGFDNREDGLLFSGTKEEIQSYTKELISKYGTTGILLGADCSFPAGIDKQRIQWVVDAVKNI